MFQDRTFLTYLFGIPKLFYVLSDLGVSSGLGGFCSFINELKFALMLYLCLAPNVTSPCIDFFKFSSPSAGEVLCLDSGALVLLWEISSGHSLHPVFSNMAMR